MAKTSKKADELGGPPVSVDIAELGSDALPKNEEDVEPTLSAFFGHNKVRLAAFLTSVKKAKISRFTQSDESNAWELMNTNDVSGERLWMLLSQSNLPDAVNRWVWPITQSRLATIVGGRFDPLNQTTAESLSAIRDFIGSAAFDPSGRPDIDNWGRIGIRWLMEKRSVDTWQVADELGRHLFKSLSEARRVASRGIERGRSSEFMQIVAMAAMAKGIVENAQRERDTERQTALNLREQLSRANKEKQSLESRISDLSDQLNAKSAELAKAHAQLEAERHHAGHDLIETRSAQQALLRDRIAPLLSDAVDALEIEPPAPDVALRRLKNIIAIIEKANQ
ncbi:hypothetical protein BST63_15480 [Bradyrhizobium canariense]|uniref:Uncharacterized protein n=1 Tax=Bradyrhizobium canariense TaxID=255045 RepID=A0ABX3X3A1_9BRAD|nr:hypothetical protein [Bradyrhizobium canariense]OSJ19455.1 hypothetical protein BSR47_02830 [Bradyrhizobium canariense]OSJ28927.1 hypothetical protein BST63_15480 [Bradyrhizobium canariense]